MAVLLELPLPVVQRAHLTSLQPARNAVEMESVLHTRNTKLLTNRPHVATINKTHIAHAPGHSTLLAGGGRLIRLALDAQVHDVIAANGTVVHDNVPGPQSDGVPLQTKIQMLEHYTNAYTEERI